MDTQQPLINVDNNKDEMSKKSNKTMGTAGHSNKSECDPKMMQHKHTFNKESATPITNEQVHHVESPKSNPSKPVTTGWGSMPSTSVFRAVNFELFVKPNKFVMAFGVIAFTSCVSYIAYMNLTDDIKKETYVTLDEDGGTTVRKKTSKWN